MKRLIMSALVVAGALASSAAFAQTGVGRVGGGQAVGSTEARSEFVAAIVRQWGPHVTEVYKTDADQWAAELAQTLANASLDTLARAARARSFSAMNDALLAGDSAPTLSGEVAQKLGDAAIDLVYVPVTPCRIIDTRLAGGAIAANTTRNFDVSVVGSYAFQGGDATDCNVGGVGSFAAAVVNFTVVTPAAAGYITAFPYLGTQPVASNLNYVAGDVKGNLAIVKLDQGASADELSVYSLAQTHLVADIIGYFINPQATDPECTNTTVSTFNIPAGSNTFFNNPSCPVGYKASTPYCWTATAGVYSQGSGFNGNTATNATFCAWNNTTGAAQNVFGGNVCCRVPGR